MALLPGELPAVVLAVGEAVAVEDFATDERVEPSSEQRELGVAGAAAAPSAAQRPPLRGARRPLPERSPLSATTT